MSDRIRTRLLQNGINSLKEVGWDFADEENILTYPTFKYYFISMLDDMRGIDDKTDNCINELLEEINQLE